MGLELITDRKFMQDTVIPFLQKMMVADWDNVEDPRLAAEELYGMIIMHLNPPD